MNTKPLIQRLTSKQLENWLIGITFIMMVLSFSDPTSWAMFIGLVMLAPFGLGYGWAAFVDRIDDSKEYAIEFGKKTHLVIGLAFSVFIGMIWAVVGTRVPVFPLNPYTNELFLLVAPKVIFLLWAFCTAALGYWRAWKTIVPNTGRH